MDLTHPIRSVVPSLTGPVLQALAQSSAPASLSEVHRRAADGSVSGVRLVLESLVEQGVVTHSPAGYLLNTEHLAFPAISLLAELRTAFNDRLREWAEQHTSQVQAVGVYGSMARRDGTPDSDIDLLLVAPEEADRDALRDDLSERITAWTGNAAQVLVFTPGQVEQMRRDRDPLFASWERELRLLWGDRQWVFG